MFDDEKLLQIARETCEAEGWVWLHPVEISKSNGKWQVRTNCEAIGVNATLILDPESGEVIQKSYAPR
jgi:hypothetical protein